MEIIVFIVLLMLFISLILFVIFKLLSDDKKIRNNVTNTDSLMRHYCFALTINQPDTVSQLSIHNVKDTLEYTFDVNHLTIVFLHLGASIEHHLSFYVFENKTYLKVSRVKFIHERSNIPLMINKFFVEKIGAVPVDYSYFESIIANQINHEILSTK